MKITKNKKWKGIKLTLNYFGKIDNNFGVEKEPTTTTYIDDTFPQSKRNIPFNHIIFHNRALSNKLNSHYFWLNENQSLSNDSTTLIFDQININDHEKINNKHFYNYINNFPYFNRVNTVNRILSSKRNIANRNIFNKKYKNDKFKSLERFPKLKSNDKKIKFNSFLNQSKENRKNEEAKKPYLNRINDFNSFLNYNTFSKKNLSLMRIEGVDYDCIDHYNNIFNEKKILDRVKNKTISKNKNKSLIIFPKTKSLSGKQYKLKSAKYDSEKENRNKKRSIIKNENVLLFNKLKNDLKNKNCL